VTVDLLRVDADDPRLDRLLQLYIHEWSGLLDIPIGADARYEYEGLAHYRDRDVRAAYLFLDGVAPLGFALARRDERGRWNVEEFFVVTGARRRGLGAAAARRLFAGHPGPWTFTVRPENPAALAFWRATLPGAAEEVEVGHDRVARRRLSFAWEPDPGR